MGLRDDKDPRKVIIGSSYFLEAEFAQAAVSFGTSVTSPQRKSVDPVLLAYICLKRSGQNAEAEALLSKEIMEFKGEPADHLLLLLYGQRFTRYPYEVVRQFEDKGRTAFFVGELPIAIGDPLAGTRDLWRSVALGEKGTIYTAAAQVELERMQTVNSQ